MGTFSSLHSLHPPDIAYACLLTHSNGLHCDCDCFQFVTRAVGTHTGKMMGKIEPTNIKVYSPPQMSSVTFNAEGQATHLTVGYVMDRQLGNTGGLGGVFGLLHAIGKSPFAFPEGRPWKPSFRYRLFMFMGNLAGKLSGFFAKKDE